MLGLFDKYYTRKELTDISERFTTPNLDFQNPIVEDNGYNGHSWYCFVPKIMVDLDFLNRKLLPRQGKRTTYLIDSSTILVSDPIEVIARLRKVYYDSIQKINEDIVKGLKMK